MLEHTSMLALATQSHPPRDTATPCDNFPTTDPHHIQADNPLTVTFTATIKVCGEEGKEEKDISINIQFHLTWKTDYGILNYLLTSSTARGELRHYVYHIQELFPQTVFIKHPTFTAPLTFGMNTSDKQFRHRLTERIHTNLSHVNKTTTRKFNSDDRLNW